MIHCDVCGARAAHLSDAPEGNLCDVCWAGWYAKKVARELREENHPTARRPRPEPEPETEQDPS